MKITKIMGDPGTELASRGDYRVENFGYLKKDKTGTWTYFQWGSGTLLQKDLYAIADKVKELNRRDRSKAITKAVNQVVSQRNKPYSDPSPAY